MKLLKKSEIDQAKAQDQQREINEGSKIARRVDSLREIHSQEEASLEKFRKESVSSISREINLLSKQKDNLTKDVEFLEEKKREAIEPLDKLFLSVKEKQDEVDRKTEEFRKMNEEFLLKRDDIDKNLAESKISVKRAEDMEERAKKSLSQAETLRQKSENLMKNSDEYYKSTYNKLKEFEKSLLDKEKVILSKERDVENKTQFNLQRQESLNAKEKEINDKYQTLLRTLNRKL